MKVRRKQQPVAALRRPHAPQRRSAIKHSRIIETATRYFAEHGFEGARAEDIAKEMGIAKGSIFQHFKTKEGLFFAVFKKAAADLGTYLDVPEEIRSRGFFAVVDYWLAWSTTVPETAVAPHRIFTIGILGTDLRPKREINDFLRTEDPFGTREFVKFGIERGEVRSDVDPEMSTSVVDWLVDRFQDAVIYDEFDPGLIRGDGRTSAATQERVRQFGKLIRSALAK